MKKNYLLFFSFLLSFLGYSQVALYSFSQRNETYQELTGGTSLWTATSSSSFDDLEQDVTIPFNFVFNEKTYTTINVNTNGSIIFPGATATTTTSSPISSSTAYDGAVAGWGRDINSAYDSSFESSVKYEVIGTAPNRKLVIQYKNVRPVYSSSSVNINLINFQIVLEETTNLIHIVYGSHSTFSGTTVSSSTAQIGLRGATNSDYNNRLNTSTVNFNSSISGTSNSSTQAFSTDSSSVQGMPVSGLTYTFTPPVNCTGLPQGGTVSKVAQLVCPGATPASITVANPNPGFKGFTYQWEESDDNGITDAWTNVSGGSGATTMIYTPTTFAGTTDKYYRLKITCTISGQSTYSDVHNVSAARGPNSATNMTFTNIADSGLTINWDNSNGNRRVLLINTTNSFTPLTDTSGPAYTNGTTLSGGDLLIWDGTAASINITGMTCNTTYYFRLYEYIRCGTSPNYDYWHAVPLEGNITTNSFVNSLNTNTLPISNNFTGFTGSNLSTVFIGWEERVGDGPLTGTNSNWTSSSVFSVTTAKINLYTNTRKEWIVTPTIAIDTATRVRFKAAITDYSNDNVDPTGMQGTDDEVSVMITSDACGTTWVPLYTFNATTTNTLTNILTDYLIDIPVEYIGKTVRIGFKATDGPVDDSSDYDFHITDINIENTPAPVISNIITVDNSCFGEEFGSAIVVVEDGASPFTYEWLPTGGNAATATNLAAGTYTITVTDAINRSVTDSITINQPDEILLDFVYNSISCNGSNDGSASVAPSGGVAPYTILWSTNETGNVVSNLIDGDYSVTVTDSTGCSVIKDFNITDPEPLLVSVISQNNVTITGGNDGSATVNATGGTGSYSYLWSPTGGTTDTASNLTAGTYVVSIIDANGCSTTETIVITEPIPLTIDLVSQTNVSCNGGNDGEIIIDAKGDYPPFTFSWSPSVGNGVSASNLSAGTYTVTLTDSNNQIVTEDFVITEPMVLNITVDTVINTTCNGGNDGSATVSVLGGTSPYNYTWSNGETGVTAVKLNGGNHSVLITDANGCEVQEFFIVEQPDALMINTLNLVDASCNGQADGSISISVNGGTPPYIYNWSNGGTGANVNNLLGGDYTVTVTDNNGCKLVKNFVVIDPAFVHPPTMKVNQGFCSDNSPKLSDVVITGNNIQWYDAITGGNILPSTTPLVNGATYYASQTVNGCESSSRTVVYISLSQGVSLLTTFMDVCHNLKILDVTIDGNSYSQLKWYNSLTSSITLPSNHLLTNGVYYVSTFNGICESIKHPIQINVLPAVPVPTIGTQVICGFKTFGEVNIPSVPGGVINWYTSPNSSTVKLATDQILSGTYYVEQVVGLCKSPRIAVHVQVIPITPPIILDVTVCDGVTIADYNTKIPTRYIWYNDDITTTPIDETAIITSGVFYIAEEISGCISNRAKVDVIVNPVPLKPTGQLVQSFGFAATVANLKMNELNVEWYGSHNDAVSLSNQLSGSTLLQDGHTYYAVIRGVGNCPSYPTEVRVILNVNTDEFDLTYLKYYPNPTDSDFNIEYNEVIKKVEIYTIAGQKVLTKEFNDRQIKLDLSRYDSGTYMVRIETKKASQFIKIVKK